MALQAASERGISTMVRKAITLGRTFSHGQEHQQRWSWQMSILPLESPSGRTYYVHCYVRTQPLLPSPNNAKLSLGISVRSKRQTSQANIFPKFQKFSIAVPTMWLHNTIIFWYTIPILGALFANSLSSHTLLIDFPFRIQLYLHPFSNFTFAYPNSIRSTATTTFPRPYTRLSVVTLNVTQRRRVFELYSWRGTYRITIYSGIQANKHINK